MSFNFDEIIDRKNSDSGKWKQYPTDVLPLWVADMDFKSPDAVIEALKQRIEHGVFGYPAASAGLSEAVVDWMAKRHGWAISTEQLLFVPGVIAGFNLVAQAFVGSGKILVQTPAYPPFLHVAENAPAAEIRNQLVIGKDHYEIDFDAFEAQAAAGASVFMLCNPQNPSGRVFTRPELERLAEICLRHNLLICSDEIHSDLIFTGHRHIPMASIAPEVAARTITLVAPSKTFNVAGLKTAIAIAPSKEMLQQLIKAKKGVLGSPNLLGQVAAEAAYRHGEAWLEALLLYLQNNRDYLSTFISRHLPGINYLPSQGTYLAWLDCRSLNLPESPYQFFLKEAKVGLNDGKEFGANSEGFVRINFGCPLPILKEALNRMQTALTEHGYINSK
jgi:cysteine-S-conjugate beta-lyase